MSAERQADGSTYYKVPHTLTDLTIFGHSVLDKGPVEWRIWPDGWGYVATLVNPYSGASKLQVDGMQRVYTTWGPIEVIA
jgi:hypothetical protein